MIGLRPESPVCLLLRHESKQVCVTFSLMVGSLTLSNYCKGKNCQYHGPVFQKQLQYNVPQMHLNMIFYSQGPSSACMGGGAKITCSLHTEDEATRRWPGGSSRPRMALPPCSRPGKPRGFWAASAQLRVMQKFEPAQREPTPARDRCLLVTLGLIGVYRSGLCDAGKEAFWL